MKEIDAVYASLMHALRDRAIEHGFMQETVPIDCHPLTPEEAIGRPDDLDYPIIKGREAMVEARFKDAKGQAFSDTYGRNTFTIEELLQRFPETNRSRAEFIATLNAVYRHLNLIDKTVHCKDNEPRECAKELAERIGEGVKVLLVGFQPRMLEALAAQNQVMALDLDADNIGQEKFGVEISGPDKTREGIDWCSLILATGSTIVNGTLTDFLQAGKPVLFYGVTISAAARILGLDAFCFCGH